MGAGTGFVGLHLVDSAKTVEQLIAVESSCSAVNMCRDNLLAYDRRADLAKETMCSPVEALVPGRFMPGDAIVANPPYLPSPPWKRRFLNQDALYGTDLLCHLIHLSNKMSIPLALCYSTLAQPEVDQSLEHEEGLRVRLLLERKLPLRVALPASTISWLLAERGLLVDDADVFQFHHAVRVVAMSR